MTDDIFGPPLVRSPKKLYDVDRSLPPPPPKSRRSDGHYKSDNEKPLEIKPIESPAVFLAAPSSAASVPSLSLKEKEEIMFCEMIQEGKSSSAAAMELLGADSRAGGVSRKKARAKARQLLHSPAVVERLKEFTHKHNVTLARVAEEIDKGLRLAQLGSHSSYVSLALRLNEWAEGRHEEDKKPKEAPDVTLINNLIIEAENRGVV